MLTKSRYFKVKITTLTAPEQSRQKNKSLTVQASLPTFTFYLRKHAEMSLNG